VKILVCVKQVPNPEATLSVNEAGTWVEEKGIGFDLNEYDRYALEEALSIKDAQGAEVVALTVGPDRASTALKTCLAMGADRGYHLKDEAFQGGDPAATARAIGAVVDKEEGFDLIFTGLLADDDNFSMTGVLLAGRLDVPHASAVMAAELMDGGKQIRVERELEGDRRLVVDLPLPAVLTVQTGINEPRYASLRGIMAAKKKEIATPSPADLGLEAGETGEAGSRLKLVSLSVPPKGEGGEILEGSPEEVARELVRRIREATGVV